ncbi:MAG: ABC transporter ATP-binding protein [Oligoflexia bacterium]|nr:ABC transporter ATP-binding protein [Oligoflexia bacterium]
MGKSEAVLEFKNVNKTFPGSPPVRAVKSLSLKVERGDFAALIGPSGSGKSTVLNLAAGLDQPTKGQVYIGGEKTTGLSQADLCKLRRNRIGFIFQSYNLFPVLTAVENAEYTCIIRGESPSKARKQAEDALIAVGLKNYFHRYPTELSGGQQQRVAVARALCTKPDIIFADEPTANLDSKTALQLIELFEELNQKFGVTFLFSTHDHTLVNRVKRRFEMHDGEMSES